MSTSTYDESTPANSTAANVIGTDIQDVRQDLRERMQQAGARFTGHDVDVPTTQEQHDGKPCVGWENQTDRDDSGFITLVWTHDGVTGLLRYYGPDHSTKPNMLEFLAGDGEVLGAVSAPQTIAAGAHARATFSDPLPVTGYLKRIVYKASDAAGAPNRTLKKIKIVVGTPPSGSSLVVTFRKRTVAQQSPSTDPYTDGTTTALTDATATLVAGAYSVEQTITPETLLPGEELVAKYGTTGSAADVTVLSQVE